MQLRMREQTRSRKFFIPVPVAPITVEFPGAREQFRSRFSGNPNRLRICELANSRGAEFSAKSGTLYTAEWQTGIGSDHRIDENHSRFQVRREELLFLG